VVSAEFTTAGVAAGAETNAYSITVTNMGTSRSSSAVSVVALLSSSLSNYHSKYTAYDECTCRGNSRLGSKTGTPATQLSLAQPCPTPAMKAFSEESHAAVAA
jgi:hypothetical protein